MADEPRRDRRRLDRLLQRCRRIADDLGPAAGRAAFDELLDLAGQLSESMAADEQWLARNVIGQVLERAACAAGIHDRPGIAPRLLGLTGCSSIGAWRRAAAELLVQCGEAAASRDAPHEPDTRAVDFRVYRVVHYIDQHFREPDLSLRAIAAHVHLSPWHVARVLKRQTGRGFVTHVRQRRIAAALGLLEESTLTVKEIANAVGCGDASQFCRQFKQACGMTPQSFRQERAGRSHPGPARP